MGRIARRLYRHAANICIRIYGLHGGLNFICNALKYRHFVYRPCYSYNLFLSVIFIEIE